MDHKHEGLLARIICVVLSFVTVPYGHEGEMYSITAAKIERANKRIIVYKLAIWTIKFFFCIAILSIVKMIML